MKPRHLIVVFISALVLSLTLVPIRYTASDEKAWMISDRKPIPGILGANTNNTNDAENQCPGSSPIMGWIDYTGRKTIVYSLEKGQSVSACFQTIDHARSEGYELITE